MSENYKRCSICDHCNAEKDNDTEAREFVFDKSTAQYHCLDCAGVIQDTVFEMEWLDSDWDGSHIEAYWKREGSRKKGQFMPADPEKARRGGVQARKFRGYDPSGDPDAVPVAPTSSDLDAIEQEWEDLLKEMDLGEIE